MRVNKHKESEEEKLYKNMRVLKELNDEDSTDAINEDAKDIANIAEAKYKQVIEEVNKMKPEEGRIDLQEFWKMKKKLFPHSRDPPSAMIDKEKNVLTTNKAIESLALDVYSDRLKSN